MKKRHVPLCLLLSLNLLVFGYTQAYSQKKSKIWSSYVKDYQKHQPSLLPDFSYAGYHHGEIAVPQVKDKVFNVCDYGAVANDLKSDRVAVEKAIKAAEAHGSGIVYFPAGRFLLHEEGETNAPIVIHSGRIVLKGAGAGINGTELFMKEPLRAPNPKEKWTSPSLFSFSGRAFAPILTDVTADASVGSFSVEVNDSQRLKPGDYVCLRLCNNARTVIERELSPYKIEDDWTNLIIDGVQINDYHQIVSVQPHKVTFKEPLLRAVRKDENWQIQAYPHIAEVGVEDIAFIGNWKEKFIHHKDDVHDGGWKFIEFKNVTNSWIRRCRFTDMSEMATITTSANVSVYDCVITGNTGHNAVHSQGSTRVFLGGIKDTPSQWHSVGVTKNTYGTVIWRVSTQASSCFESHASQPRFTLFDACQGGFMQGRAGGAIFNNPNHLEGLVLWNYQMLNQGTKNFKFWADNTRYFRFMPPIIVGFQNADQTFDEKQVAYLECLGHQVNPESLYEAQLALRLGAVPEWLVQLKKQVQHDSFAGNLPNTNEVSVKDASQLCVAVEQYKSGDLILLEDGDYKDLKLIVRRSGSSSNPFIIKAQHPGKVRFTGDVKVELRGNYVTLDGISFVEGARNPKQWKSHGPGLVAIYGDHVEVSNCLFQDFDEANSAYITTSLDDQDRVPQYAYIHHCAFIGKRTLDQVINLNNKRKKELTGDPGLPMYHRIQYCYFSNPKKKGNAGGAIRVGYWRKDLGRCLVSDNLFERQDSEAEIITSKSQENVYYNNTFLNCQGTMNLRHGDHQVLLNNFFIGTDKKHEYGGMFIWGSNHLIACNFFFLPTTLKSRGNSALYLNCGPKASEHALAYDNAILNNTFIGTAGTDINLAALYERRVADFGKDSVLLPYDNRFVGNRFFSENAKTQPLLYDPQGVADKQFWLENYYNGMETGLDNVLDGLTRDNRATLRYDDSKVYVEDLPFPDVQTIQTYLPYRHIEGIELDFLDIVKNGTALSPLTRTNVGPDWCRGLLRAYDE